MNFNYGSDKLTLKKVTQLAQGLRRGFLLPEVISGIHKNNEIVQDIVRSKKAVYGSAQSTARHDFGYRPYRKR